MKDSIDGGTPSSDFKTYTTDYQYNVNITGDNTGTFYMLNNINNANIIFNNTTINTVNNNIHTYNFNSLTVNGNTNFVADVDLKSQTMDKIIASSYGAHSGKLNVLDMNIVKDSTAKKVEIYFAQPGFKDYITTSKTEYMSPIFKYNINYENRNDAGYFVFTKGSSSDFSNLNPAVASEPISTQGAGQVTMSNTLSASFEHADNFMNMDATDRFAILNSNSYAMKNDEKLAFSSTDYNENLNHIDVDHTNKGVWVKPYTSFESINLKNGPIVDLISYGTLVGADSDFKKLRHGWYNVGTAYIGYNGSTLSYKNVDSTTNGGTLGLTETFYKGNLWTAITASVGAGVTSTDTMYGHEDSTMLMAGVASKTGYNFEFKQGKLIIQPRMQVAYSMVNTFDYTNAAVVKIDSNPLHTIQLYPSVRVIGNINGWQPYATVGAVWNALNSSNVTANGVKLPEMSIKPYAEYGVGLQRCWKDKYSAYGQALLRSGGRNGIALTFGFRLALGKDNTAKLFNENKTAKTKKVKVNRSAKLKPTKAKQAKIKIGSNEHNGTKHVLKEAKIKQIHRVSKIDEE